MNFQFLLLFLLWRCSRGQEVNEVRQHNLCSLCSCSGHQEVVVCASEPKLVFRELTHSITYLKILNSSQVEFQLSFKVEKNLTVEIVKSDTVIIYPNTFNLKGEATHLFLNATKVDQVEFKSHCVSGIGGRVYVNADSCVTVTIGSSAFDVLTKVNISNVAILRPSTSAFKYSVLRENPDLQILISNISQTLSLPNGIFSSAKAIIIKDSKVQDVAPSAFSGILMDTVSFVNSSVDRIHSEAFSPFSLINSLSFVSCNFTTISEKCLQSAISKLRIENCKFDSVSKEAIDCQVAKVVIRGNVFKTLPKNSLSLSSWSELVLQNNTIQFMDSEALYALVPADQKSDHPNPSFNLEFNEIIYVNRDALKLNKSISTENVSLHVKGNRFSRKCECGVLSWLKFLSDGPLWSLLLNSSYCTVPETLQRCFDQNDTMHISIQAYLDRVCGEKDPRLLSDEELCGNLSVWNVLQDQIDLTKNKGILLTILVTAIIFSLLVSIVTLIRWIIYTLRLRSRNRHYEEEWNFTKIQERHCSSSPTTPMLKDTDDTLETNADHNYEHLRMEESSSSNKLDGNEDKNTLKSDVTSIKSKQEKTDDTVDLITIHTNPGAEASPPKLTFYDEMIDMMRTKLEDPENYGTVADNRNPGLYQDPFDVQTEEK